MSSSYLRYRYWYLHMELKLKFRMKITGKKLNLYLQFTKYFMLRLRVVVLGDLDLKGVRIIDGS